MCLCIVLLPGQSLGVKLRLGRLVLNFVTSAPALGELPLPPGLGSGGAGELGGLAKPSAPWTRTRGYFPNSLPPSCLSSQHHLTCQVCNFLFFHFQTKPNKIPMYFNPLFLHWLSSSNHSYFFKDLASSVLHFLISHSLRSLTTTVAMPPPLLLKGPGRCHSAWNDLSLVILTF